MGTACSALHGSHGERVIEFEGGGRDASTRLRRQATEDERDIVNHAVLLEGQGLDARRFHSCEMEISLQALPMVPILVRTREQGMPPRRARGAPHVGGIKRRARDSASGFRRLAFDPEPHSA
jgi:hypothetical protein